jgi:NarL family two-component system response regulator YdfI
MKILIADDHLIVRAGLKYVISTAAEYTVVGEAENGTDLMRRVQELLPDIVITDIQMPGMSGLEAAKQIKEDFSAIAVIILSQIKEMRRVHEALSLGVDAYLLKDSAHDNLLSAIQAVSQGQVFLSPELPDRAKIMADFDSGLTRAQPWLAEKQNDALARVLAFQKHMAAMPLILYPTSGSDEQIVEKLTYLLVKEKIHTNEKLTLAKAAVAVGIEPRRLSEVVVKYLGVTYPQLLNWYRVKEALLMLSAEEPAKSIDVAFAAGFNTKSQYNLVFKSITGLTPLEYQEVARAKN